MDMLDSGVVCVALTGVSTRQGGAAACRRRRPLLPLASPLRLPAVPAAASRRRLAPIDAMMAEALQPSAALSASAARAVTASAVDGATPLIGVKLLTTTLPAGVPVALAMSQRIAATAACSAATE